MNCKFGDIFISFYINIYFLKVLPQMTVYFAGEFYDDFVLDVIFLGLVTNMCSCYRKALYHLSIPPLFLGVELVKRCKAAVGWFYMSLRKHVIAVTLPGW